MADLFFWIAVALILGAFAFFVIRDAICLNKMTMEEKEQKIKEFVSGGVVWAEKQIGPGNGQTKLKLVEDYFADKAPIFYKLVLKFLGKDNLKDLIEQSLNDIKENFGK